MDLIERQAAEEALYDWEMCYTWDEHCREDYDSPYIVSPTKVIEALPSAEPVRMKGKWTWVPDREDEHITRLQCSVCHMGAFDETEFCPNCGADMRGE